MHVLYSLTLAAALVAPDLTPACSSITCADVSSHRGRDPEGAERWVLSANHAAWVNSFRFELPEPWRCRQRALNVVLDLDGSPCGGRCIPPLELTRRDGQCCPICWAKDHVRRALGGAQARTQSPLLIAYPSHSLLS